MKKILVIFLVQLAVITVKAQSGRLSEQAGLVKKQSNLPHGVAFELSNGYAEIIAYNPTTIRVRVGRQKFTSDHSFAIDNLESLFQFL